MEHPSIYAGSLQMDLQTLSQNKSKTVYRTVHNLVKGLNDRLQMSSKQIITRSSYWQTAYEDAQKIQFMVNGLVQTYGEGQEEKMIIASINNLIRSIKQFYDATVPQNQPLQQQQQHKTIMENILAQNANPQLLSPIQQNQYKQQPQQYSQKEASNQQIEERLAQYQKQLFSDFLYPLQDEVNELINKFNDNVENQKLQKQEVESYKNKVENVVLNLQNNQQVITQLQQDFYEFNNKLSAFNSSTSKQQLLEQTVKDNHQLKQQVNILEKKLCDLEKLILMQNKPTQQQNQNVQQYQQPAQFQQPIQQPAQQFQQNIQQSTVVQRQPAQNIQQTLNLQQTQAQPSFRNQNVYKPEPAANLNAPSAKQLKNYSQIPIQNTQEPAQTTMAYSNYNLARSAKRMTK